jgi:hypothetical protein
VALLLLLLLLVWLLLCLAHQVTCFCRGTSYASGYET